MTGALSPEERVERKTESSEGLFRQPSRRDRDRIRYTREFRRLKGVTQVARAGESYLYHDRLTHSMKVAQIASSLAYIFHKRHGVPAEVTAGYEKPSNPDSIAKSLDPFVVEAASHAHDIGHPPFGHAGETTLDEILNCLTEDWDRQLGFEGNAQSFRIVSRLTAHRGGSKGLNLTRATLNGMLKYPWSRKENDGKWGYYPSDSEAFEFARQPLGPSRDGEKTLEAQIMDYADDLTYAVHDLDDFFRTGLIPLDRLLREAIGEKGSESGSENIYKKYSIQSRDELDRFEEYLEEGDSIDLDGFDVAEFLKDLAVNFDGSTKALLSPFKGTDAEREALNLFTSELIAKYLEAKRESNPKFVYLEKEDDGIYNFKSKYITEIDLLKELTRYYVIANPSLMQQQRGQKRLLRELFNDLYEEASSDTLPRSAIPSPYRERIKNADDNSPIERIVVDLIASMTERQAVGLHKRLRGTTPGALENEILG